MSRFHAQTGHFVLSSSPFSVSTEMRRLHFYLRCGRGRGLAVVRREDDYIVSQCLPQHLSLSFIKCLFMIKFLSVQGRIIPLAIFSQSMSVYLPD